MQCVFTQAGSLGDVAVRRYDVRRRKRTSRPLAFMSTRPNTTLADCGMIGMAGIPESDFL
jgi:hypothetical protein